MSELQNQIQLWCNGHYTTPNNFSYIVTDKNNVIVASGISSDESWAKHDASGLHTKKNFDAKYGENNWHVNFEF